MDDIITVIVREQQRHSGILERILANQEKIMAAQDDIDAAVAAIGTAVSTLGADVTAIQGELASGGTPVNTSALTSAISDLVGAVNSVTALVPGSGPAPGGGAVQ
jgi:hypothetical protein